MKKLLIGGSPMTRIKGIFEMNVWCTAVVAILFLAAGLALSHRVNHGVSVRTVNIGGDIPVIQFLPAGPGPHPVVLFAHGYTAWKESCFFYGEAFAAAGFECFMPDLPGHGASAQPYSFNRAVQTLEDVEHAVGPVDVFVGHSMGGLAGGEAVREGGLKTKLFIAVGSLPHWADRGPSLLLLAGRFDEYFPPTLLRARANARLVISPWSNHTLELFDPLLVNAAVEAACAAVGKPPPDVPTYGYWRLVGIMLGMVGTLGITLSLPKLPPRWAWGHGFFVSAIFVIVFVLTVWMPFGMTHARTFPMMISMITGTFLAFSLFCAQRLRLHRSAFLALAVVVWFGCTIARVNVPELWSPFFMPALIAGTIVGWIAASRGSQLAGDIAMAIIVGCAVGLGEWIVPQKAPPHPFPTIKLDAKYHGDFEGLYEFAPNNVFYIGMKLKVWRLGDELIGQVWGRNINEESFDIYPRLDKKFLFATNGEHWTFIKNDGEKVTGVIYHETGLPDSEGTKVGND